jgi:methylated-DNA-[protein]-cysteine S-methyltransferase
MAVSAPKMAAPDLEWGYFQLREGFSLSIAANERALQRIEFLSSSTNPGNQSLPVITEAIRQLRAYFNGQLRDFDLPLEMIGTQFQKRVWHALRTIPYGETRSYSQVAAEIGSPNAVRAVGAANGKNPIPIVVPCHRVIGAGGDLVGFGGGLPWKRLLLDLESKYADRGR